MAWSWRAPQLREPFDPNREADRRDRAGAAEPREPTAIESARHQLADGLRAGVVKLEHEPGVIIEAAAEGGGKADATDVDAACGKKAGAALEQVERGVERDLGLAREGAQVRRGLIGIAAEGWDARNGEPVGEDGRGRLGVGAGERGEHALVFRPRVRGAEGKPIEIL